MKRKIFVVLMLFCAAAVFSAEPGGSAAPFAPPSLSDPGS